MNAFSKLLNTLINSFMKLCSNTFSKVKMPSCQNTRFNNQLSSCYIRLKLNVRQITSVRHLITIIKPEILIVKFILKLGLRKIHNSYKSKVQSHRQRFCISNPNPWTHPLKCFTLVLFSIFFLLRILQNGWVSIF